MIQKEKKRFVFEKWFPGWAVLPLLTILMVNCLIYWGSGILTSGRYHFDFTTALDRAVPLVPEFVWIYILAFPFWACNYILASWRGKDLFYRFVATDLVVHGACFVVFLLIPTTNVRPELTGTGISEQVLALIYALDGGEAPSNLLPSIHCYVSWLCWRGLKDAPEIPKWYRDFSLLFAVLIIVSTQVLKQHYLVDAVSALVLVEGAWAFFRKGNRHKKLMDFFERTQRSCLRS